MASATNQAILDGKRAVYVFDAYFAQFENVNGYDAIGTIYRNTAPGVVAYKGKRYAVQLRKYGCGVHNVECIFIQSGR